MDMDNKNSLKNRPRFYKWILALSIVAIIVFTPFAMSEHVINSAAPYILSTEQSSQLEADCVLVLGAGVTGTQLSSMLKDRMDTAIEVFAIGAGKKLLLSGDNSRKDYDEVTAMKLYAVENSDVTAEDIFIDYAGFSTYESMYRAKEIFCAEKVLIVTQQYHLYRAVYDARKLGLDAYGVAAVEPYKYSGQLWREAREILARTKDIVYCAVKMPPTYLGDTVPIYGESNG